MSHSSAILPVLFNISGSFSEPMLMCTLTASAPNCNAFSTLVTCTLWYGSTLKSVLADKCKINPMSLPYPRCPFFTIPLCINTAFAPPLATESMVSVILINPGIGPPDIPWSIGAITHLPVLRFIILSILILFPIIVSHSNFMR